MSKTTWGVIGYGYQLKWENLNLDAMPKLIGLDPFPEGITSEEKREILEDNDVSLDEIGECIEQTDSNGVVISEGIIANNEVFVFIPTFYPWQSYEIELVAKHIKNDKQATEYLLNVLRPYISDTISDDDIRSGIDYFSRRRESE
jgi:hypothetical protein